MSDPSRSVSTRRWPPRAAIGAAVLVALVVAGWPWLHRDPPAAAGPTGAAPAGAAPAGAAATAGAAGTAAAAGGRFRPTAAQLESFVITPVAADDFHSSSRVEGTIVMNDEKSTPVLSPYSGRVTRLAVQAGDVVRRGAPLFYVWASEAVQGQDDLRNALAASRSAAAQLELARAAERRQHDMFEQQVGAKKDWLQSRSDLVAAQSAVATADANLAAVRDRLRVMGRSDADIHAMEGAKAPAAEVAVVAPIDGTVTQRQVGVGQNIQGVSSGGSTPQLVISDLRTVWLVANVRESDAAAVKTGDTAKVTIDALPGRTFDATITWVSPVLDPNTHRLPVRAVVDNRDGVLKPSMLARFDIDLGDPGRAVGVPARAVVREGDAAHVWVVEADGSLAARDVRLGRERDGRVEIVAGLMPGERIVERGALFIDRASGRDAP